MAKKLMRFWLKQNKLKRVNKLVLLNNIIVDNDNDNDNDDDNDNDNDNDNDGNDNNKVVGAMLPTGKLLGPKNGHMHELWGLETLVDE